MASTDNQMKKQLDPLSEWKSSKKEVYGMIVIGITIMIFVSSLLSYGLFVKGIGAAIGPFGSGEGVKVEDDPIAAHGYFIISMVAFNFFGMVFVAGGIMSKNRLAKMYHIDKSLMVGNTFKNIAEKFFDLWISTFAQSSLIFESNSEKREILIPDKNIRVTYFFGDDKPSDPNVKYYCTVEIKPINHRSIFSKTTKYVEERDLLEVIRIIEQIFDPKIISGYHNLKKASTP